MKNMQDCSPQGHRIHHFWFKSIPEKTLLQSTCVATSGLVFALFWQVYEFDVEIYNPIFYWWDQSLRWPSTWQQLHLYISRLRIKVWGRLDEYRVGRNIRQLPLFKGFKGQTKPACFFGGTMVFAEQFIIFTVNSAPLSQACSLSKC